MESEEEASIESNEFKNEQIIEEILDMVNPSEIDESKRNESVAKSEVIRSDRFLQYVVQNDKKKSLFKLAKMMENELNKEEHYDLIEDYIFNQDDFLNEGSGGFKVKPFEDEHIHGLFRINDFLWIGDKEKSRFVVAYSRLPSRYQESSQLDEYGEYILNVYENEKLVNTLKCRSEILKICIDTIEGRELVFAGLQNGRVAIWDLGDKRKRPTMLSRPHLNSNFLPIVQIGMFTTTLFIIYFYTFVVLFYPSKSY